MLNQVIQVKNMRWQAFAPCLGGWLCKNFLLRGFNIRRLCDAGETCRRTMGNTKIICYNESYLLAVPNS